MAPDVRAFLIEYNRYWLLIDRGKFTGNATGTNGQSRAYFTALTENRFFVPALFETVKNRVHIFLVITTITQSVYEKKYDAKGYDRENDKQSTGGNKNVSTNFSDKRKQAFC